MSEKSSIHNDVTLPEIRIKKNLQKFKQNKFQNESDRQVYSQMGFKSAFDSKKSSLRSSSVLKNNSNSHYNNFSNNRSIISSASKNNSENRFNPRNPYFESQMSSLGK